MKDIELEILKIKPCRPSTNVQDYMHLPNFKENLNNLQRFSQLQGPGTSAIFQFTRQTQIEILKALIAGATIPIALSLAKVKEKTFAFWESLAQRDIEPYASFIAECRMAEAGLDMELIQKMRSGGWKGAVELWNLRHPESNPNKTSGPVINQTVNILEKRPEERLQLINEVKPSIPSSNQPIDYSQIVDVDPD